MAQVLCVILDKVSAQEFGVGATHMLALPHYVLNVFVQTLVQSYTLTAVRTLGISMDETDATQLVEGSLESELVPGPVEYYALLPPGYSGAIDPIPLVLNLHGGGGSREALMNQQPALEALFATDRIPSMLFVTPSVSPRCFYMDYKDGTEKWESFLAGPFLEHLRDRFRLRTDRRGTMVTGISMGGMGSLRLAFKHPTVFGAVAALEPGIEPINDFKDMRPKHRFFRDEKLLTTIFGKPIDAEYWNVNNPATIAQRDAELIKSSDLKILLEAGDEDAFWLYEGTEYLHQVLYNEKIRHEYRLYYGADHVGRTVGPRADDAYAFLGRVLEDPAPDLVVDATREWLAQFKRELDEADHYGVDENMIKRI